MTTYWLVYGAALVVVYFVYRWGNPRGIKTAAPPNPSAYFARLQQAAELVHGKIVLQRSTVGGHLCWNASGYPYYYYEKSHGPDRWSVISVAVRDKLLPTYQVRPREGPVPTLPPLRLRPPLAGAGEFDGHFEIRVGPSAPDTLAPSNDVCMHLLDLADLCFPTHPVLEVHENRARLYVPMVLDSIERRRSFLTKGQRIMEAILTEFVDVEIGQCVQLIDVFFVDGAIEEICQVCGEQIGQERVLCARCSTPHHRECWVYAGACSIFGCQSTKFKER